MTTELSHESVTVSDATRVQETKVESLALVPDAKPPAFRFVDLFAGIGGIRLGLERAGGECVYSVEIDRHARRTYEANFGRCEAMDIRDVRPEDLPAYDVLAAGFPCQPFSIAGVSKKLSLGREHGFADKTSGNLFFEIVRLAEATSPPILFLENVKNLRSHDRGNTFRVILGELDRLGYEVTHDIIDARSWVPQHRERTFIMGLNRARFHGTKFEFPPLPGTSQPVMRDVLDSWFDQKYVLTEHLWEYLQEYSRKHRAAGNGFGFGLVTGNDVSRTLSARYYKDGSEILVDTAGKRPRRLTPVECARLMGYPDPYQVAPATPLSDIAPLPNRFVIPVSDTQAYKQFGNSVVVPVVEHLGRAVAERLTPTASLAAAS
jgi:DNA (cytosine-5)-methyltransferase 1